jgi:hypothetical protein
VVRSVVNEPGDADLVGADEPVAAHPVGLLRQPAGCLQHLSEVDKPSAGDPRVALHVMRALSHGIGLAPQLDAPLTRRFDERGPAVAVRR